MYVYMCIYAWKKLITMINWDSSQGYKDNSIYRENGYDTLHQQNEGKHHMVTPIEAEKTFDTIQHHF